MRSVTRTLVVAAACVLLAACESDAPSQQDVAAGEDTTQDAVSTGTLSGILTGSDGAGVPGAEITTEPSAGAAISKTDGGWRIDGVPAGTYTVFVARTGYVSAKKEAVTVKGGSTTIVDFLLFSDVIEEETGAITGIVQDAGGAAIGGALVELAPETLSTVTAADGAFAFATVTPGTVSLTVSKDGFETLVAPLTVVASETLTPTLTLVAIPGTGRLQGHVMQMGLGLPVVGAAISTSPESGETTTGIDGAWTLDGLAEGTYVVHAVLSGFDDAMSEASVVEAGKTTIVDLTMDSQPADDSSCTGCHTTKARIMMDLEADPIPEPPGEAGSAGEG